MASILTTAALAALIAIPSAPPAVDANAGVSPMLVQAQGDCRAAAAQVVRQTGGQLLSAQPSGNTCVVIVLVPGKGNERPSRKTVRVPM